MSAGTKVGTASTVSVNCSARQPVIDRRPTMTRRKNLSFIDCVYWLGCIMAMHIFSTQT